MLPVSGHPESFRQRETVSSLRVSEWANVQSTHMKKFTTLSIIAGTAVILAASVFVSTLNAAEGSNPTKEFMKKFHKAPKGVDPICKKATDGKASPAELAGLVAGYKAMTTAKPPKGDDASWKEKTTKVLEAAMALQKGAADGAAKYKEALNCKACHSAHKPD